MWLRSPGTNGAIYAWPVYPTGSVSLGTFTVVSDVSYGNISQFMDSDDVVWTVWLDGGIYGNRPMVDNGSYGYKNRRTGFGTMVPYLVNPSGDVDVDYGNDYRNIVYDSYGFIRINLSGITEK